MAGTNRTYIFAQPGAPRGQGTTHDLLIRIRHILWPIPMLPGLLPTAASQADGRSTRGKPYRAIARRTQGVLHTHCASNVWAIARRTQGILHTNLCHNAWAIALRTQRTPRAITRRTQQTPPASLRISRLLLSTLFAFVFYAGLHGLDEMELDPGGSGKELVRYNSQPRLVLRQTPWVDPFPSVQEEHPPKEVSAPARLLALARFYPERVDPPLFSNGDWWIKVGGEWYCWAEGRMLPEGSPEADIEVQLPIWDNEELDVPVWMRKIFPEDAEIYLRVNAAYGFDPSQRSEAFFDALYGLDGSNRDGTRMREVYFLGHSVKLHPIVIPALKRVETRLFQEAVLDQELADYLEETESISGFAWRTIAGTSRRSFHAMGIALDIIPEYYALRQPYWRWALEAGIEAWWQMAPRQYWKPPNRLVQIFEEEGFVWGGRWTEFDTIHFEYRPELMLFEEALDFPAPKSH